MKQLIIIIASLLAGGVIGGLIVRSQHKCSEKGQVAGTDTLKGTKKPKGNFNRISLKEALSLSNAYMQWMGAGTKKGSAPVKFGGYFSKNALEALIASVPDSVRAIRYVIGRMPNGQLSPLLIGGIRYFSTGTMSTSEEGVVLATAPDYYYVDSSQTYCPPMCNIAVWAESYPAFILADPAKDSNDADGE